VYYVNIALGNLFLACLFVGGSVSLLVLAFLFLKNKNNVLHVWLVQKACPDSYRDYKKRLQKRWQGNSKTRSGFRVFCCGALGLVLL
jgi:hypothetical protein